MYIIVSSFEIKPEHRQDFIKAALEDGRNSRLHEQGIRRFELVEDESDPNHFYLSEAYENKKAFEDHTKGDFFNAFFKAISGYSTHTDLVKGRLIPSSDEKNENLNENLKAVYQQLCESYRAIDDFRTKLLGFLPLATGGGIFLLLGPLSNQTQPYLGPIGAFGLAITFGLFCHELYGITKCHNLIVTGGRIERQLGIHGQFLNRPREVACFINEPFAAGIIYPAVGAAWMFLALAFPLPQDAAWPSYALGIAIVVFLVGFAVTAFYNWWLGKNRGKLVWLYPKS